MIKEQQSNSRSAAIGQYVHNLQPRHGYTFGGVSRPNQSAHKQDSYKDQFGLLQEVNRHQYVGKSTSLNPKPMSSRAQSASKLPRARAFYPTEYFKRVGYQQSEASQVSGKSRTDALGQRVRQRFNEEIDYKDAAAQGMPVNRLNRQTLGGMSSNGSAAGLSVKGSQRSKVTSVAESAHRRPGSQCATSTASRRMALRRAFQNKQADAEGLSIRTGASQ